jgi:hypothetical protein
MIAGNGTLGLQHQKISPDCGQRGSDRLSYLLHRAKSRTKQMLPDRRIANILHPAAPSIPDQFYAKCG